MPNLAYYSAKPRGRTGRLPNNIGLRFVGPKVINWRLWPFPPRPNNRGRGLGKKGPLVTFFTTPGFTDELIHIYKATGLTPGKQNLDHDEVLEAVALPLKEAIGRIEDGTIRDGKTIVGLQAVFLLGLGL